MVVALSSSNVALFDTAVEYSVVVVVLLDTAVGYRYSYIDLDPTIGSAIKNHSNKMEEL